MSNKFDSLFIYSLTIKIDVKQREMQNYFSPEQYCFSSDNGNLTISMGSLNDPSATTVNIILSGCANKIISAGKCIIIG